MADLDLTDEEVKLIGRFRWLQKRSKIIAPISFVAIIFGWFAFLTFTPWLALLSAGPLIYILYKLDKVGDKFLEEVKECSHSDSDASQQP